MNYQKQTWVDGPEGGTPLSAIRMGHIEDGIEDAHEEALLRGGVTFDLQKANPIFGISVYPPQQAVMQCVWIDPTTGDIFTSQIDQGTVAGERETAIITKYTVGGVFVSRAILTDAGHATVFFTETVGGTTYVVMNWIRYNTAGAGSTYDHNLVRFPFPTAAGDTTLTWANVSSTKLNSFVVPSQYVTAALDAQKDIVLMRETRNNQEYFYLRKWSELKAGIDNKLTGEIVTGSASEVVQGWATDGATQMFRYMGSGTGYVPYQDITVMSYSWATLSKTGERNLNRLRYEADGTEEDGWSEPEGMSTYRDGRGRLHLLAGVSTGVMGRRRHKVHSLTMASTTPFEHGGNLIRRWASGWEPDLRARRIDPNSTTLEANNKPGWYYITGAEMNLMTDKPSDWPAGNAGYLENSGRSTGNDAFIQRLYRSSTVAEAGQAYHRLVTSGADSPWFRPRLGANYSKKQSNTSSTGFAAPTSYGEINTGLTSGDYRVTVKAQAGDWIDLGMTFAVNNASSDLRGDMQVLNSGVYVSGASATENGVPGWGAIGGRFDQRGAVFPYQVQAADIDASGDVTFVPVFKSTTATLRTVYSSTLGDRFTCWARNVSR